MIISLILTLALFILFLYGWGQKAKTRSVGSVIYITSVIGVILVWFPDFATLVANKVGVGRGADLVFYMFIVISLIVIFSLYLKINKLSYALTVIARRIAIDNPVVIGDRDSNSRKSGNK